MGIPSIKDVNFANPLVGIIPPYRGIKETGITFANLIVNTLAPVQAEILRKTGATKAIRLAIDATKHAVKHGGNNYRSDISNILLRSISKH